MHRRTIGTWLLATTALLTASASSPAGEPGLPLKAGIIGLDAHARSWTRILNNPEATGELADVVVVAGYPGGSPDIPQSMDLLKKGVEAFRQMDIEIVESIDALLEKVDVVMILSIDGRPHLEQARPVIAARKPMFIDKPMAASLADAIRIFRLAQAAGVPCFSSSSLRFAPGTQAVLEDPKVGEIRGANAFSPCGLEPHHPDFFWYGIHGVETLFTIMGTGCKTVTRAQTDNMEIAVGVWDDGRIGTFRGTREGPHTYGATVFGSKAIVQSGKFEGYEPLLVEIVRFFKTGKAPVDPETTLEILAFMEAADQSKRLGGRPVSIESVVEAARKEVGPGPDKRPAPNAREASLGPPPQITPAPVFRETVAIDAEGQITLGHSRVTLAQLAGLVASAATRLGAVEVSIDADPDVEHQHVVQVLDACSRAGAVRVRLAVSKTCRSKD
ncbi:MAG: biopolymer transporter ExbD [Planctomycetota bacterium]|jgi:predicted dehydrogenase